MRSITIIAAIVAVSVTLMTAGVAMADPDLIAELEKKLQIWKDKAQEQKAENKELKQENKKLKQENKKLERENKKLGNQLEKVRNIKDSKKAQIANMTDGLTEMNALKAELETMKTDMQYMEGFLDIENNRERYDTYVSNMKEEQALLELKMKKQQAWLEYANDWHQFHSQFNTVYSLMIGTTDYYALIGTSSWNASRSYNYELYVDSDNDRLNKTNLEKFAEPEHHQAYNVTEPIHIQHNYSIVCESQNEWWPFPVSADAQNDTKIIIDPQPTQENSTGYSLNNSDTYNWRIQNTTVNITGTINVMQGPFWSDYSSEPYTLHDDYSKCAFYRLNDNGTWRVPFE